MDTKKNKKTDNDIANQKADSLRHIQEIAVKNYEYLQDLRPEQLPYAYAKAMSEKACSTIFELSLIPFPELHKTVFDFFKEYANCEKFYLSINDYGELEPDMARIEKLKI